MDRWSPLESLNQCYVHNFVVCELLYSDINYTYERMIPLLVLGLTILFAVVHKGTRVPLYIGIGMVLLRELMYCTIGEKFFIIFLYRDWHSFAKGANVLLLLLLLLLLLIEEP